MIESVKEKYNCHKLYANVDFASPHLPFMEMSMSKFLILQQERDREKEREKD